MIHEILLVGGASWSQYLRDRICKTFRDCEGSEAPYTIPICMPNNSAVGTATCVAQGALLMLMDRSFIRERMLRRGYCVGVQKECRKKQKGAFPDKLDGGWRRVVTEFLVKAEDRIPINHRASVLQGHWRSLRLSEISDRGWPLFEHLYCYEGACRNGLSIDVNKDIEHCGDTISFWISPADAQDFEIKQSALGQDFKYLEYRIDAIFRENDIQYEILIPRSGKFASDNSFGADPIRIEGHLELGGAFSLVNND